VLSFEIFPPKKEANISKIYTVLEEVFPLNPDFISVTYGTAGAGVPGKTAEIAQTV
jgi:methylenetetrahydrofolate reductase (NADPH)